MNLRMRSLLAFAAAALMAQGCKKASQTPVYPIKYHFAEVGSLSGISTYDSRGRVSAPGSESASEPFIVHIDSAFAGVGQNYSGLEISIVSVSQIEFRTSIDVNTVDYTRSGDTIKVAGFFGNYADTARFRVTGDELHLLYMAFAYRNSAANKKASGIGAFQYDPYQSAYKGTPGSNDTIAVRTFDVVFRRQ